MKNKFCILFLIIFGIINTFFPTGSYAVTANPNPVEYRQPDGSVLTIIPKGDEFIHWAVTLDGYTLLSNSNKAYVYACLSSDGKLTFSDIPAHNAGLRNSAELNFLKTINKALFFSDSQLNGMKSLRKGSGSKNMTDMGGFPTTGTRSHLLILANFSNTSSTYTQSDFDNLMNQENYNNTGSFRDFYLEVSNGQLTINNTVTIWVTLSHPHDYYGPQSMWGTFAYDAVVAADQQTDINYADYDNDLDGNVDGVCIAHQGRGQEESGNSNDIWSHSWSLIDAGYSTSQLTFDGVVVSDYTTIPEKGGPGAMTTIGVMCHEFGHNLGSPDFYDTDYGTSGQYDGTGSWDVMADGSWNGSPAGSKPPHFNPWTKIFFTWCTPITITSQQTVLVRNIQTYPDIYRFNTTTANEYFLCENRQKTGFNTPLPGHGMIIYHVNGNYISSHYNANDINCTLYQGLYPMSATSTTANGVMQSGSSTINSSGCPWPGTSNKTAFTDVTTPNSKSWAGANTDKPIVSISENTTTKEITFCFLSCPDPLDPQNFTATTSSSSQINLDWQPNSANNPVMVAYNLTDTFGTPATGTIYLTGDTIAGGGTVLYNGSDTSYNHSGLDPNTTYYYKAWSVVTGSTYSVGIMDSATTFCSPNSLPFSESFSSSTPPDCWSQIDHIGSDQIWQFGDISDPNLPGNYAYLNSHAFGYGNVQNADLITPTIDCSGYTEVTLQFKHYFKYKTGSMATLSYSIDNGYTWTTLQTWTSTTDNPENFNQTIPELDSQSQVRIKWNFTGFFGYFWAVDNIQVTGTNLNPTLSVSPLNQDVSCLADSTEFTITSNTSWNVTSDQTWCVPTQNGSGNGIITANYTKNESMDMRVAHLTVTASGVTPVVVTVSQEGIVGVPESFDQTVQIIPNPNHGHFTLNAEKLNGKSMTVTIYDHTGKLIHSGLFIGSKSYNFDLNTRPGGEYLMKITYDGKWIIKKLILE